MTENFKIHGAVDKDFTKVPKALIRNKSISSDAKIILEFLIDLTGDFSVNERGLSSILGISLFKVGNAVNELETAGYIRKQRVMNGTKFAGWSWDISAFPIFRPNLSDTEKSDLKKSDTNNSDLKNSDTEKSDTNFSNPTDQLYIKDRKDTRPTDTRLKEEETKGEETEESVCTPTLTPLSPSGKSIISQQELNITQAFNRFCEVYPNLGDIDQARAAFFAIPDIDKICHQIVNSVEWFEKSKRWDNWTTGQKNVACPKAVKFLKQGDWRQFLNSGEFMSEEERIMAALNRSRQNSNSIFGGAEYGTN